MKKYFFLAITLLIFEALSAQDSAYVLSYDTVYHHTKFQARVDQANGVKESGWLEKVSDNSILLSSSAKYYSINAALTANNKELPSNEITAIHLKKKGRIGRGIMWGALAGAAAGGIAAILMNSSQSSATNSSSYNDFFGSQPLFSEETTQAMSAGIVVGTTIAGGILGGIIGALTTKTFTINGKSEKMRAMKQKLNRKCFDLVPVYRMK